MSTVHNVHLTLKAVRLLELCEAEGFENIESLLEASICDSVCPAICMECGCTAQMEPDQRAGYCEQCGKNKVVSAAHPRFRVSPRTSHDVRPVCREVGGANRVGEGS